MKTLRRNLLSRLKDTLSSIKQGCVGLDRSAEPYEDFAYPRNASRCVGNRLEHINMNFTHKPIIERPRAYASCFPSEIFDRSHRVS